MAKKKRKQRDRWDELCRLVREDDGLPVRDNVGAWSLDKLFFWHRYIDITTTAMVGHSQWKAGLIYVDLFAGPGVSISGAGRFPGSPLIAAAAPKPFRRILLCEKRKDLAEACETRLAKIETDSEIQIFKTDCNKAIDEIVNRIPKRALTLAFIDPTGLHARFATLKKLAACGRVDMLILLADHMDIVRNVEAYYLRPSSKKLDYVLGAGSHWRSRWENLSTRTPSNISKMFAETYRDQLRKIGYAVFGEKVIRANNRPIYRLIYASKHDRGLEFWGNVTKKERGGQREPALFTGA